MGEHCTIQNDIDILENLIKEEKKSIRAKPVKQVIKKKIRK